MRGPLCGILALLTFTAPPLWPQSARPRTYANPIDIDYRYNYEQKEQGISYRSGADPVIVVHRGEYYLFETLGEGYWRSRDLGTWQHITPTRWPLLDAVAPAALSVRDTIYFMPSTTQPLPILTLTAPATGRVEFYNRRLPWLPMGRDREGNTPARPDSVQPGPWDPQFFHDPDTERWFLYWNSSNLYPLHAIELDKSKRLAYKGTPKWLFGLDPERHGWERFGQDHRDTIRPFIEGAWMTKHRGRYYLQYGAPGTEYNVYATGTYVGDDPLGPFTYAPYNPVGYKPGGFVQGAGHGNTFQDVHGNWWNTGTPWVAVNWNFERRIALFPAGFDADGQFFVNTRFGDFPHWLPRHNRGARDATFTGWMLLSYKKPVDASSARDSFPALHITDENPRTFWVARTNRPGEQLTLDLGRAYEVRAVQVNYTDYKSGLFGTDTTVYTAFRLRASVDGRQWTTVADLSRSRRDRPNAYVELAAPVRARFVRYDHVHVGAAHLAISDLRVFGNGSGPPPAIPEGLSARRDRDERNAILAWQPVAGSVGYNVRWGISPTKLYQTYQRFADQGTTLELRALTVGQAYWVAIESFDENGVSRISAPVPILPAEP
jgi:xylan 1,4-beta-xylosidase